MGGLGFNQFIVTIGQWYRQGEGTAVCLKFVDGLIYRIFHRICDEFSSIDIADFEFGEGFHDQGSGFRIAFVDHQLGCVHGVFNYKGTVLMVVFDFDFEILN